MRLRLGTCVHHQVMTDINVRTHLLDLSTAVPTDERTYLLQLR